MKKGIVAFVSAVQPLYTGSRIVSGNKLATLGEEVSECKNKVTKDEILLNTEAQYWQIVSLEEKQKTIEKYREFLARLLEQVQDAFNSGVVIKNDVLKVKLKLSEVYLNKSKLENGKTLAMMAFCQYIGITYDATLLLKDALKIDPMPENLYVENSEALKKRTEYSLLEKSVAAEKTPNPYEIGRIPSSTRLRLKWNVLEI